MSRGSQQIVVRTPPRDVEMLADLRAFFGMSNSRLVRKLIRDAHERLPNSKVVTPNRENKLAAKIERAKGEKRSGLVRPEPPACTTHEWEMVDDETKQCSVCMAVKLC